MREVDRPCVEIDVETSGLQYYSPKHSAFLAQALPDNQKPHEDNVVVADLRTGEQRERIENALAYCETAKIGLRAHNARFDLHFLKDAGFKLPPDNLWQDSELLCKLTDERSSAALKARHDAIFRSQGSDLQTAVHENILRLNKEYREHAKETGEETEYANYEDIYNDGPEGKELMYKYAANDCVLQRELSNHQIRVIKADPKLVDLYELERDTMVAMFHAEDRGVPVDRNAFIKLEAKLLEDHETILQDCIRLAGIKTFNPGSPKQVLEALERRGADTSRMDMGKTQKKTDEENLRGVNDELAFRILDFRGVSKMLSTYASPALHRTFQKGKMPGWREPFITGDDLIHANFRTWGARTGRMSCAEPNLQNIPRDDLRLRYTWAARPGYKLICADMDQIEARILAALAGEGRLMTAFKNGDDIHQMTADLVGLGDFTRAGGFVDAARQRGKKYGYSKMYGAGVRSVKKSFFTDDAGARRMNAAYDAAFPEVRALNERIAYTLADQGYVRTPGVGRRQRRDNVPYDVSYKYLNYLIQGTAADLIKEATVRVHKAGIPIIAVIHDEIVAHVPEEDAAEAAHEIQLALTEFPRITDYVPLDAEAKIVSRWSDAKTKGDAPHFVPDYMKD